MNKPDIAFRSDIERLIDAFYEKVKADPLIGYIFTEVARVDWPKHLPVMYDFWEFLLLGGQAYRGNPIEKHFALHARHPLGAEHFDRWLALFQETVDELFEGANADAAKFRAYAISETWKPKFAGGHGVGLPPV
ncbi:MAG: group III truncated hemoglobin [Saprospirales bacterium]|jgi:hemoglobin|nr:group III truncated hemoglobin [Saprospirales bacterium]MBK8923379.1 group III truncated hemoglobin [Saprospirales bacterium]